MRAALKLLRWAFAIGLAVLPSILKIPLYRWLFGYQIGRRVKIGFSPFFRVRQCVIGDNARIGSLNLFTQIKHLAIGSHVKIGILNVFRGGDRQTIGPYSTILRLNVFNAIVDADAVKPLNSVLDLGPGVFVATGHWLDFSDGIRIGGHSIIGGRHSSFWTHNRQRARAIEIGCHTYLGSEIRVAPGAEVPSFSVVALGSVLTGKTDGSRVLIGGNPATVVRNLEIRDLGLVIRKTRNDIPDNVAHALLPDDLRALACEETRPEVGKDIDAAAGSNTS